MERWKPIKGYEGLYEVSDQGNVRSIDRYCKTNIRHVKKTLDKRKNSKEKFKKKRLLYC